MSPMNAWIATAIIIAQLRRPADDEGVMVSSETPRPQLDPGAEASIEESIA